MYFKNVSTKTTSWYRKSFHAFDGAMESKAAIGERIGQLRERGISVISVNTYLQCVNAFHRWAHGEGHLRELIRIPKLKHDQKVLATLTAEQVTCIRACQPRALGARRTR